MKLIWTNWIENWFHKEWYQYLFAKKHPDVSWLTVLRCRMTGHKPVFYFNAGGLEPDMRCTGCMDDLG